MNSGSGSIGDGFRLGHIEVRPSEQCILNNGTTRHIEPKAMAVLMELAQHPDETVSREDLVSAVWPRGFVSDDVLNRCISQLRHAFDDDPRAPDFIVTVPRKGYRLVAPVVLEKKEQVNGILVMPFQNLAAHGRDEYLADGLTELLIARLAVAADQRVISRTTAMSFRGRDHDMSTIRKKLGVKWVIEGSLLQLGSRLQIVVQLIDSEQDTHVWADTWTRPVEDILSVLNEVTRQVSNQVHARLSAVPEQARADIGLPAELTRRFLQGNHHASQRAAPALKLAIECFNDVLDEVPDHAPAMAGLAMCHMLLAHYGAVPVDEGVPLARNFAKRALAIDPQNAEAMSHLAAVHFFYDWDFEAAARLADKALEIKPQFELAMMIAANINLVRGHYEKSQVLVDRAINTDPLNFGVLMNAGDLLILQRRYGEAINSLSQALELQPASRPACLRLALAQALHGLDEEAVISLETAASLGGNDAVLLEYQALIAGLGGRRDEAGRAALEIENRAQAGETALPWSLARAWAAAGDEEKASKFLHLAYDTHSSSMPFLAQTPVFSSVRLRPEIQELMHRVGLATG